MNVPGLSGSWQDRNRQLYEKLGSPLGKYTGSYDQNIYLLNKLKSNNYYKSGLPGTTAKSTSTTDTSLAKQYAAPGVEAGKAASETPVFTEVMPFDELWNQYIPLATQSAQQQVDPELNRDLRKNMREYMGQLASTGGGRFGRAMGGVGSLQAASARSRQAQVSDWLDAYQKGFDEFFYSPSREMWTKASTSARKNMDLTPPTWEEFMNKYSQSTGTNMSNVGSSRLNSIISPTSVGSQYTLF